MCLALSSRFVGVWRGGPWQEVASRAKVWGGVSRQREQQRQSPQDRRPPPWLQEGAAVGREQAGHRREPWS